MFCMTAAASTGKPKVLLLDQIKLATSELKQLLSDANAVKSTAKTHQELSNKFWSSGRYLDVVGIYHHFGGACSIKATGWFDTRPVSKLPKSLCYIVHNDVGYNQLNVHTLSANCIHT